MVEQIDQIDVAIDVSVLVTELHHHPAQLQILSLGHIRYQTNDSQGLFLGLREGC